MLEWLLSTSPLALLFKLLYSQCYNNNLKHFGVVCHFSLKSMSSLNQLVCGKKQLSSSLYLVAK